MNNFKNSLKTDIKNTDNVLNAKQNLKNRLFQILCKELEEIRLSDIDEKSKLAQEDMLLDVLHFLLDYEKNIKILNEHVHTDKLNDR